MSKRRRRLLSISHSYVVALNRRLSNELARICGDDWEVTALAPRRFHGDLRDIDLEITPQEPNELRSISAHLTSRSHFFYYGRELVSTLRENWDLVHMWEEPYVVAGAQVALLTKRNVPLVFSTYQNIGKSYPAPFQQFEKFVVRRSNGWIAGGETIASVLNERPLYGERSMSIIPMGVDQERFQPDPVVKAAIHERLGWSSTGAPVVGYLGRFVPEKGIRLLCAALTRASQDWRALFVGGGPLDSEIRAWAAPFGDRVKIIKSVSHDEVPDYLNAMDMLCAPSQTTPAWREQFGRMLVEAFACGVPVVASDSGEIPHTMGRAGLVIKEDDEAAWTRAIDSLLESREKRQDLAEKGRARAISTFGWPVVARRTLDFFEQVLLAPHAALRDVPAAGFPGQFG